jgi:hypothetical protein
MNLKIQVRETLRMKYGEKSREITRIEEAADDPFLE